MASQLHARPYRSHLRPACQACRQRKSRCKVDDGPDCLMCRVHGTECLFTKVNSPKRSTLKSALSSRTPPASAPAPAVEWTIEKHQDQDAPESPVYLDHADEEENPHIVGPAVTSDSSVLADYLATIPNGGRGIRAIRTVPGSDSGRVIFTSVRKHPVGMSVVSSTSATKCQVIEKLLEPWLPHLIDLYFAKANTCLPLLDEASFKDQYTNAKDRISPALLACLYAHATAFWFYDGQLAVQRCPDTRFIWNLANEALYSELHLSPGMSTVTAVLLNIGGRPTTSMIGNGVQLGSAVSLSHSLGLNRNPLPWDIPQSEKHLRMQIWWSLVIYDRWSSLAYGTPPHIRRSQYDVPLPRLRYLCADGASERLLSATAVFIALASLTEVLDVYLEQIYQFDKDQNEPPGNLELVLNQWIESLDGEVRKIITRGTQLNIPGAANLRLAYLSVKLLLRRIELNADRNDTHITNHGSSGSRSRSTMLTNRYVQTRRTVEDIVLLIQELQQPQLADFWLPTSAFAFTSATTFLLRCALEIDRTSASISQSPSLGMAHDLLGALRRHKEGYGWDLGDLCVAQYAGVVDKLLATTATEERVNASESHRNEEALGLPPLPLSPQPLFMMPSGSADLDQLFPNIWDTLQDF